MVDDLWAGRLESSDLWRAAAARPIYENGADWPRAPRQEWHDQSLCQVWLLQISPPNTQPLILSELPESEALPE